MSTVTDAAQPRVAVVCGGPSAEAEVSRSSAREVTDALRQRFGEVALFEYEPRLADGLPEFGPDVVVPVMHGPPGEDGTLQGFLDTVGLPYVGSGVCASAVAMDKPIAKLVFRAAGLPVAEDVTLRGSEGAAAAAERALETLGERVVVKPADSGSALGIVRCDGAEEVRDGVRDVLATSPVVLVERWIAGAEVTAGVLEEPGDGPVAFPTIEILTPPGAWYDYEHRYTEGLSEHRIPAGIPSDADVRVRDVACRAHSALGCRDLSRADFVVGDGGEVALLEVNTLPGMTPTSLYPDGAAAAGIEFPDLVERLVQAALARGA